MSDESSASGEPARVHLNPGWLRLVLIGVLVVVFVLAVARYVKNDIASGWEVVATCRAADPPTTRVAFEVDTDACEQHPDDIDDLRGWPIVTFALPAEAGREPEVTAVHVDRKSRALSLDYDAPSGAGTPSVMGYTLVFVELSPDDIPTGPFTIVDAEGPTVVSSLPTPS